MKDGGPKHASCLPCGHTFEVPDDAEIARCPICAATVRVGATTIHVTGESADEVSVVARRLATDAALRVETARLRSPWLSGLFYLLVLVVVAALILVIASVLA